MDKPLARHLVHKLDEGNVLLGNLRRVLPSCIPGETLDSICGPITGADRDALISAITTSVTSTGRPETTPFLAGSTYRRPKASIVNMSCVCATVARPG